MNQYVKRTQRDYSLFFKLAAVKVMNTDFGATLTKKQLATLSRKYKFRDSQKPAPASGWV